MTQDHELFVALQVDERRAAGRARPARARSRARPATRSHARCSCASCSTFATRFDPSDVVVEGALNPRMLARAIRLGFDPYGRERAEPPRDRGTGARRRRSRRPAGPTAADVALEQLPDRRRRPSHVLGRAVAAPRRRARRSSSPLLLDAQAVRSVAIALEPIAPDRARREVEAQITTDEADEQLRAERGFRTTARQRQQQQRDAASASASWPTATRRSASPAT